MYRFQDVASKRGVHQYVSTKSLRDTLKKLEFCEFQRNAVSLYNMKLHEYLYHMEVHLFVLF